jgi:mitochondrial fission protein ELM1
VHAGSWELSNLICASLDFPFNLFVRVQKFPRLNGLLESLRLQKGCRLIRRQNQLRAAIEVLRRNEALGMTVDQGGKQGLPVPFFGKNASMATGAMKLARAYGCAVVPAFYTRVRGAHIKAIVAPALELVVTEDEDADIRNNLCAAIKVFENFIRAYPAEYLWTYKVWKYSTQAQAVILSDGKTGHLRQSEAVAQAWTRVQVRSGRQAQVVVIEVRYKNSFMRALMALGLRSARGCLHPDTLHALERVSADAVISCGSSVAAVNDVFAQACGARAISVLRPSLPSMRRFDLVVMPRHDNPPARSNIAVTEGALTALTPESASAQAAFLRGVIGERAPQARSALGFLVGGDTAHFTLTEAYVSRCVKGLLDWCAAHRCMLLVSTSRRTPVAIETFLRTRLQNDPRCALLLIPRTQNYPFAVGGILGLSRVAVVTPESISMISEAASSGARTLVPCASDARCGKRHERFLARAAAQGYVRTVAPSQDLAGALEQAWREADTAPLLNDRCVLERALGRVAG